MGIVCQICGDKGFIAAIVACESCNNRHIHRYCLNILPVPIEECVTWYCADCDESEDEEDHQPSEESEKNHQLNEVEEEEEDIEPKGPESSGSAITSESTALVVTNGVSVPEDATTVFDDRAKPIKEPIWRGSISIKTGNVRSVEGLFGHLSSLACIEVHDKAITMHSCLYAEMFPRLEIWPISFLKRAPTDESIALYFFPSSDDDEKKRKVYDSLVSDMKKKDLGMRCAVEDVNLLLFTSDQLPTDCCTFNSKEYLWGIFRRRKIVRH